MIDIKILANYFENPALLLWIIPLFIILYILLRLGKPKHHADVQHLRRRRRTIFFTRSLIFLCIFLALASPFFLRERFVKGDYAITLIADNSASFQIFDMQTAQRLEEKLSDYIKVNPVIIGDPSNTPLSDTLIEQLQEGNNVLLITDGYNTIGPELSSVVLQATKVNASIHALQLQPLKLDSSIIIT